MKQFNDYQDGDLVLFKGKVYKAYKSKYTSLAFRLKSTDGGDDDIADFSEVTPFGTEQTDENVTPNLQPGFGHARGTTDSDADSSGIYHIYDDYKD